MIRNVVMGSLSESADLGQVEVALAGIAGLSLPGMLNCSAGRDAGLRPGGWSFAVVNDWVDVASYQAYDLDAEHNRYRSMLVANCDDIARVQLDLDQP